MSDFSLNWSWSCSDLCAQKNNNKYVQSALFHTEVNTETTEDHLCDFIHKLMCSGNQ